MSSLKLADSLRGKRVLVVGARGLVGGAAASEFAAAGAEVHGVSRSKPELAQLAHWHSVDLTDAAACRSALSPLQRFDAVVYCALFEEPRLIEGWRSERQIDTNARMFGNTLDALGSAGHLSLLQGTKAYGAHVAPMALPGRERTPRHDHDNFYWHQEDALRDRAADFPFTIFRPQVVMGSALQSPMNTMLALGLYAAVEREKGGPLACPGTAGFVTELIDARLLGRALLWAATSETALGETFNITNGDVVHWPSIWPELASAFGCEPGSSVPTTFATWVSDPDNEAIWQRLVARHDLLGGSLIELGGGSWEFADAVLGTAGGGTTLLSTIKLRQAGFADCIDSADMIKQLADELRAARVLPPCS